MNASRDAPNLLIRHWRSEYLVPQSHPHPAKVRGRLDDTLRKDVPGALVARLQRAFRDADDELVFVRRLDLDFTVDAGWDPDIIATQCAQALSGRLARELADGDASNVMRFSSRAEYLARFLIDRASGDAGSRWYYAHFAGLHPLTCAAALRTVLLTDIDFGISALRILTDHNLADVVAALGDIECRRIINAFASKPPGDDAQAFASLIPLAHDAVPSGVTSAQQLALWWLARSTLDIDGSSASVAQAVAHVIVALRSGAVRPAALLSALLGEQSDAIATFARSDLDTYLRLRACPPALLRQLVADATKCASQTEMLGSTSFGGAFLLLDDLFALPIERATRGWPALHCVPAASVLQFVALCQCVGAARADAMFSDPLWRRLFGIAPTIGRAAVADWLVSLGPHCRRRYRRELMADAAHTTLVHDVQHRYGIRIDDDGGWRTLEHTAANASYASIADADVGADIDHLLAVGAMPQAWALPIALTAQRIVHRFLRRLPGFSASHLSYAQRNLLEFSASVDAQPERIVVLIGRPPLGMILNFTGSNRGIRHWPRLDARPFVLFNEG